MLQSSCDTSTTVIVTMQSLSLWKSNTGVFEMESRLNNLVSGTLYQIMQSNGQRIYSPRADSGILPPPKGTEVFVGNLPHDLFEDELIPLFSRKGPLYNVRVMLDFFGRNRGYAFVCYFRPEDAHAAVAAFHNYRIRKKTKMAVCISVDNRRLFIGNIPRDRSVEEIKSVLQKYVDGIVDVILYREPLNPRINRGFVFVEFESHRLAAIGRRQLAPGNLVLWGQSIFVDWAEPLPIISPEVLRQVTKLYLSNLPLLLTLDELKQTLFDIVGPSHILKVHKINNFAFVHFTIRKYAEEAMWKLQGLVIMGNQIGVEWARPIEYSKHHRVGILPENCCRSVPPGMRKMIQRTISMRKNGSSHTESSSSDYAVSESYIFKSSRY